ncbi:6-phosphogluconolactonase [Candidatus Kaiserbacteria bacterium]|nr:6-phosphogluconolactonase [Candidatus Kaiserbacteria bacterium]
MILLKTRDVVTRTNSWLTEKTLHYGASSLYVPAGESIKKILASWNKEPNPALSFLTLYQVDDIIEGPGKNVFQRFFSATLPNWKVHPPIECVQADLGILGLGTNGHVAFHEPGIPNSFRFGEVVLHEDTVWRLDVPLGTKGRTYGIAAFMDTDALLLIVRGYGKKKILKRMLKGDTSLPATALLKHRDLTVLIAQN